MIKNHQIKTHEQIKTMQFLINLDYNYCITYRSMWTALDATVGIYVDR